MVRCRWRWRPPTSRPGTRDLRALNGRLMRCRDEAPQTPHGAPYGYLRIGLRGAHKRAEISCNNAAVETDASSTGLLAPSPVGPSTVGTFRNAALSPSRFGRPPCTAVEDNNTSLFLPVLALPGGRLAILWGLLTTGLLLRGVPDVIAPRISSHWASSCASTGCMCGVNQRGTVLQGSCCW